KPKRETASSSSGWATSASIPIPPRSGLCSTAPSPCAIRGRRSRAATRRIAGRLAGAASRQLDLRRRRLVDWMAERFDTPARDGTRREEEHNAYEMSGQRVMAPALEHKDESNAE